MTKPVFMSTRSGDRSAKRAKTMSDFIAMAEDSCKDRQATEIIRQVAASYGKTYQDMIGKGRSADIYKPRRAAMWVLYQARNDDGTRRFSQPAIGRLFGGRDHTTVLHAIRRREAEIATAARSNHALSTLKAGT